MTARYDRGLSGVDARRCVGNCVLTVPRIVAISDRICLSKGGRLKKKILEDASFFFILSGQADAQQSSHPFQFRIINQVVSYASTRQFVLFRRHTKSVNFQQIGSIIAEQAFIYSEATAAATRLCGNHGRNVCNMAFNLRRIRCLATQTTAIGFHLMNQARTFGSIFAFWARLKLHLPLAPPRSTIVHRYRSARVHFFFFLFASCDLRLDDSPRCTDRSTRSLVWR